MKTYLDHVKTDDTKKKLTERNTQAIETIQGFTDHPLPTSGSKYTSVINHLLSDARSISPVNNATVQSNAYATMKSTKSSQRIDYLKKIENASALETRVAQESKNIINRSKNQSTAKHVIDTLARLSSITRNASAQEEA